MGLNVSKTGKDALTIVQLELAKGGLSKEQVIFLLKMKEGRFLRTRTELLCMLNSTFAQFAQIAQHRYLMRQACIGDLFVCICATWRR